MEVKFCQSCGMPLKYEILVRMPTVAVGATLQCKITTSLQPPKGVLQLMLTLNHSHGGKGHCQPQ